MEENDSGKESKQQKKVTKKQTEELKEYSEI